MNTRKNPTPHLQRLLLVSLVALFAAHSAKADVPEGWLLAGSNPGAYDVDKVATDRANQAARLRAQEESPDGFVTLMQKFSASQYRGQRLKLSAQVKSMDVTGWAGAWMRIDGPGGLQFGFDNMQGRPIVGTNDSKTYDVVLDVVPEAEAIAFGVLLSGGGEVLIDNIHFEVVDDSVEVTSNGADLPAEPANLDFEN